MSYCFLAVHAIHFTMQRNQCIRVSVLETWAVKFDAERVTVSIASFSSKSASLKQLKTYLVQVYFLIRKCASEKRKRAHKNKNTEFLFLGLIPVWNVSQKV